VRAVASLGRTEPDGREARRPRPLAEGILMPLIIRDRFHADSPAFAEEVGYDQLPRSTVLELAADGDEEAAAWLKDSLTASAFVNFELDEGKNPRGSRRRS